MHAIKDYQPSKPFFTMSIEELVKHSIKCKKIDKYFEKKSKNKFKKKQTKNRRNRKTRKRRKTRKLSLQKKILKIIN